MDRSFNHDENNDIMTDNPNIFDDDYAVDDFGISDGFRPGRMNSTSSRGTRAEGMEETDDEDEPTTTSVAAHFAEDTVTPSFVARPNRNSMRKSRSMLQNPFFSTEDDQDDDTSNHNTLERSISHESVSTITYAPGNANRLLSSSSSRAYGPTHSPMMGQRGPSHPYNMYPQNTHFARTMSTSTTTTTGPQFNRSSTSSQRPTHPYNMYTQNVMGDDMDSDDEGEDMRHPQTLIPLGFRGMQTSLRRRIEDDGISIAQSEQLPPYSEYPEDGAPKNIVPPHLQTETPSQSSASASSSSSLSSSSEPTESVEAELSQPQAAHTPFASRIPVSMSDLRDERPEAQSLLPHDEISTDGPVTPKKWKHKTWKEKRNTQFCGVPFVWLIFLAVAAVVIITVAAAIAASNVERNHYVPVASSSSKAATTVTETPQAEQVGNPTITPTYWDVSPITTSTTAAIPTGTYAINLGAATESQNECLTNTSQSAAWSCDMAQESGLLMTVGYTSGSSRLGAYVYNPAGDDPYNYGTQPPSTAWSPLQLVTDMDNPDAGPAYQFQVFYPKLVIAPPNSFNAVPANSKRSIQWNHDHWFTKHEAVSVGEQPWFCYWNSTLLEGFIFINENYTTSNTTNNTITATPTSSSSQSSSCYQSGPSPTGLSSYSAPPAGCPSPTSDAYPAYKYIVKLEERRIPGSPSPYCQQMQLLSDGSVGAMGGIVTIEESDPGYRAYAADGFKWKRTEVEGACHCQWSS